ncbi:ATPase family AAA domain-containing protein 5 isoform X1 [Nothobranchius furzeri]|uniref:ATPase family, AAA domain containing 5a n=1 Tax=Nothobranchius furzeri TaxID=105023 RepID=A0A1A8U7P6_NOTFU|nr:transcript variant X1 [Nothobranchius furzeri]
MMAGVVAMASVIEDFDTQPCKKSRKDGGSPVVQTITNYFSPVPKAVEKPFSPPRSNNIMDYFSRKAPPSKVKASPPPESKEKDQKSQSAEKNTSSEVGKQSSGKRGRKTSKAARKLVASEGVCSTDGSSCFIVQETSKNDDSAAGAVSGSGTLGSDTAALLSKRVESGTFGNVEAKVVSDEQNPDKGSSRENCVQLRMSDTAELSPAVPVKKVTSAARKSKKKRQKETKQKEPEENESERSLCDVSMEVNQDESSLLNSSMVTISFEDFVRSQKRTEEEMNEDKSQEEDFKVSAETQESNSEKLDASKAEVVPAQVSPRTVTIQAEVYVVSAKQKVASIFNRRKASSSPVEIVEDETPAPASTVKRKSNVVLQEEDLELSVIESESTPKCSEAERKQFMAAFKQPSLDGSKAKAVKSQPKQKPGEEKTSEAAGGDVVISPSVEHVTQENEAAEKKPTRRGRRKAKDEKEAVPSSPAASVEETVLIDKEEEPPIDSAPALRRSRREAAVRNTPETTQTSPVRKSRRLKESKDAASPQDSPVKKSTPKTRRSKHGVFVAEMVGPPDAKESPIRIKFSRIHKKAEGDSTSSAKALKGSKKQKQAKKLVEKAKMIQQSKAGEEKEALRRSSRVKTSIRTSYHEEEDSVVCVEDLTASPQKAPGKRKTQKLLRSLNDVLGKTTSAGKDTKTAPAGSKVVASLSLEKSARKASAVISIFDESSREGSDNSQDDEQFRARREFLKSGLPESFRRQIARTAATKEAYGVCSSSFQLVTHTTQPPEDCPLWSLPWPESSSLGHLKEMWSQTLNPLLSISGSLCVKTLPACRSFNKRGSGWRPEISESKRQLLMEEFSTSNPHFPAQMFFTRLLKRRADHQPQITASSEPDAVTREKPCTPPSPPAEPVGGKRKRRDEERELVVKVAKKQKSNQSEEKVSEADKDPPRRGGRTRRGLRSRLEEEKPKPVSSEEDSVIVIDDPTLEEDSRKKDVVKEDLLWTEKYQPQHSSDIVDNAAAVKRLYGWLKEWKLRADREERRHQKEKRPEEGSTDSDWDCGGEDFPDGDDALCNTILITGPTGVGKTAAVYACAQELGFKVFEVNASSQRSGRLILSQLKEATQSHQVDSQGVSSYKPAYFSSYGARSSAAKLGSSPRKLNSPRKTVSSPRKTPQSPRGAKKGGLAPTSLDKFFRKNQPTKTRDEAPGDAPVKSPPASSATEKSSEEHSKKAATSLILFEEVDVIFEDDAGFLAAIKTFMSTTKRPVVLTTSDPAFSTTFDGSFEEIHFRTPSPVNVGSYLQLLCLAEDIRTTPSDVTSLLKLNGCDIRQSLLQLQFWTRSSGGRPAARPLTHPGLNAELQPQTEADASVLPPCDTGCTESKLGLKAAPERSVWDLLRSQSLMEDDVCWDLLMDSRCRGVDLLYSNMETLLPLPVTRLITSKLSKPERRVSPTLDRPNQQLVSTSLQSDSLLESEDGSPIKVSNRMKKKKRRHPRGRDGLQSGSDSEDGFPSICRQKINPQTEQAPVSVSKMIKRKPLTEDERRKSLPVSQCLESIADFWDSMSYVDSALRFHPDGVHRGTPLSSAVIKDGMLDESRVETGRGSWLVGRRVLEIQAAVEALSFQKCRVSVMEAWDRGKEAAEELALPVAAHRDGYSFTPDGPCHPQLVQQRKEVMENLTFRVFGTLGNQDAVSLDYLPAVRAICRSEQLKEQGKVKRRFLHYLDAIHLGVEKSSLALLAEDFP